MYSNQHRKSSASFFRRFGLDILLVILMAMAITLFVSLGAHAQVGINTPNPHDRAALDLTDTSRGLLIPRMSSAQRLAMFPVADATAEGMMVYQNDGAHGFYLYNGTTWQAIVAGNSNDWNKNGNAGTTPATDFLGTVDNTALILKTNATEALRITPGGLIGVGQAAPHAPLHFSNAPGDKICLRGSNPNAFYGLGSQIGLMQFYMPDSGADMAFGLGRSASFYQLARIKGNGRFILGNADNSLIPTAGIELIDTTGVRKDIVARSVSSTFHSDLLLVRMRGTPASPAAVLSGDDIGRLSGSAYNGSTLVTCSEIQYHVDSIPGAGSIPGNITFHTAAATSGSYPPERMRIDRNGHVGIGTNNPKVSLDVNGAMALRESDLVAGTITTLLNPINSYYRIGSTATASFRYVTLGDGVQIGQMLILECSANGPDGITLTDNPASSNMNLSANHAMGHDDMIQLMWNGTDWLEVSYTNN